MAGAMTQVAWGGVSFQSGYEAAGQIDHLKAMLKWGTDYIIAAHTSANEFVGQVGDAYVDHDYWGRPEEMTMARCVLVKPGLVGNMFPKTTTG